MFSMQKVLYSIIFDFLHSCGILDILIGFLVFKISFDITVDIFGPIGRLAPAAEEPLLRTA